MSPPLKEIGYIFTRVTPHIWGYKLRGCKGSNKTLILKLA